MKGDQLQQGFPMSACTACRIRRRKCDRSIPLCGNCKKYGRECVYQRKPRACNFCAQRKIRCSKDFPQCTRCATKGIQCSYSQLNDGTKEAKPEATKHGADAQNQSEASGSPRRKRRPLDKSTQPSQTATEAKKKKTAKGTDPDPKLQGLDQHHHLQVALPQTPGEFLGLQTTVASHGSLSLPSDSQKGFYQNSPTQLLEPYNANSPKFFDGASPRSFPLQAIEKTFVGRSLQTPATPCTFPLGATFCSSDQSSPRGISQFSNMAEISKDGAAHFEPQQKPQCLDGPASLNDIQSDTGFDGGTLMPFDGGTLMPFNGNKEDTSRHQSNLVSTGAEFSTVNKRGDRRGDEVDKLLSFLISPTLNRFPAATPMQGSRSNLFLSAFLQRYKTIHTFFIDIEGIQRSMDRAFADLRGTESLFSCPVEVLAKADARDRANHSSTLAAVGLGMLQVRILNREMYKDIIDLIWKALQPCALADADEVMFAHGISAQLCFLTNNTTAFMRHFRMLSQLLMGSKRKKRPEVVTMHAFFNMWLLLKTESQKELQILSWTVVQAKADLFCSLSKSFPLLYAYTKRQRQAKLKPESQLAVFTYLKDVPIHTLLFLGMACNRWIRQVVIDSSTSSTTKTEALEEVVRFVHTAAVFFKCQGKYPAALKFLIMSTQIFLMFVADQALESKGLLRRLINMLEEDPFLCIWCLSSDIIHILHFICMALSTVEMHSDYDNFQRHVNSVATFYSVKGLPIKPPISNHGLCEEEECMVVWHRVTKPKVPDFLLGVNLCNESWTMDESY